jgi:cytochrome c556
MRRLITTLLVASVVSTAASAATAPADAIKYRQAVMEGMSAHVTAIALINFGKVDHPEYLKSHANALAELAAQTKVLFPAGTDTGKTEALPLIWQEQEKFNKLVSDVEAAAAKLRDAVAANDKAGTSAAFKSLGDTCKSCHDRYRKKDD